MNKSPTIRLLIGLFVTLAAVAGFSSYNLHQLNNLRKLQTDIVDLNRHNSLLLLRVQNDLNTVGLKLRDVTQLRDTKELARYQQDVARLRVDLEDAVRAESKLRTVANSAQEQAELLDDLHEFWRTSDRVLSAARADGNITARTLVSQSLFADQATLANRVSALLERNNEAEERADQKIASIYDGAERDVYLFLAAIIAAILFTSLYLIYSNRQLFDQLQSLSRQRRVLAARLITVQEEVLRSVSRELHDEFGQILTAVGAMLARAERKGVPPDSPLRTELSEVREITHNTLEKMRSLSQMLHPAVLDDYGLAKGVEWYTEVFERQTGIRTVTNITGDVARITGQPAIHCFRIIQEALNNAAKHSGSKRASVDLHFGIDTLKVTVRDFGRGLPASKKGAKPGLGLIAMHERADLLGGKLDVSSTPETGTVVSLIMPLRQDEDAFDIKDGNLEELVSRKS